jgi:hypothetical protein
VKRGHLSKAYLLRKSINQQYYDKGPMMNYASKLDRKVAEADDEQQIVDRLLQPDGSSLIGVQYPTSSTGIVLPQKRLDSFIKSAPIDIRVALPSNYVTTGTVDYSTQIQQLLDYLRDFGGGVILFPPKLSILVGNLRIYTGTEILAQDWTSEFIVKPGGYGISINPGSNGTPDPATNQRNILLSGFQIRGQNAVPVFSEHAHLLNINAASYVLIEDLHIKGFQGDGIYLGSSNTNATERHNENISINRVRVDGVNADNRNGISIIDGTDISISEFTGLNCTREGMPGTIDIEPNANVFSRVRRITIDRFYIDGGKGGGIEFLLPPNDALTVGIEGLVVTRGVIKNKPIGIAQYSTLGVRRHGTVVRDVLIDKCFSPFLLDGMRGGLFENIRCVDADGQGQIGYVNGNADLVFNDLEMLRCGRVETNGLQVRRVVDGLTLNRARFIDCGITPGQGTGGRAILFANGTGSRIKIIGNTKIESPNTITTSPIQVDSTFILDNKSCLWDGENEIMAGGNNFLVPGRVNLTSAPTTGVWAVGNKLFRTASTNRPQGWVCVAAATTAPAAGTWRPLPFLTGGGGYGSTAGRPTTAQMGVIAGTDWSGTQYFDNSVNKLLTWNGTAWVDSAGVVVA